MSCSHKFPYILYACEALIKTCNWRHFVHYYLSLIDFNIKLIDVFIKDFWFQTAPQNNPASIRHTCPGSSRTTAGSLSAEAPLFTSLLSTRTRLGRHLSLSLSLVISMRFWRSAHHRLDFVLDLGHRQARDLFQMSHVFKPWARLDWRNSSNP